MSYLPRIVDGELAARLEASGGVVIEGPKARGKTETARQIAASEVRLDVDAEARLAISVDPALVLGGAPRASSTSGNSSPRSGTTCGARSTTAERRASSS